MRWLELRGERERRMEVPYKSRERQDILIERLDKGLPLFFHRRNRTMDLRLLHRRNRTTDLRINPKLLEDAPQRLGEILVHEFRAQMDKSIQRLIQIMREE